MKILICSVGGSPAPIIKSINELCPDKVVYIASPESRQTIRTSIEQALSWKQIRDTEVVTLSDYQNLICSLKDIRAGLEKVFKDMAVSEEDELYADITGGTKVMSSALTLVVSEYPCRLRYIGGEKRSKDGLGIVEDGAEKIYRTDNPWEVMATRKIQGLAAFFNAGVYPAAMEAVDELADRLPDRRHFFSSLRPLVDAYRLWDSFSHKEASASLSQALNRLEPYASRSDAMQTMFDAFKKDKAILDAVNGDARMLRSSYKKQVFPEGCGQAYLRDLLSNARRCANRGRFDDAVARIYSAIEKCAKIALRAGHGIDNSNVDLALVPESCREALRDVADHDGSVRLGLSMSYHLLGELDDPLGQRYKEREKELKNQLQSRNQSLLAHGYNPVEKGVYAKLFAIALSFLGIGEEELPVFAKLKWKALS